MGTELVDKPKQRTDINWSSVLALAENYVKYIESDEYCDDNDYRYYIYEAVLDAVYGAGFWAWKNNKV